MGGEETLFYLGVLQVLEHGLLSPGHTLVLVGIGVRVALSQTRLATENAVQVGTDLVGTTL